MNLQIFHALYSLDKLEPYKVADYAAGLLTQGLDSKSLRVLAGFNSESDREEIKNYLEKTFQELKLSKLSRKEATMVLAKEFARQIVNGEIEPYEGARKIWGELCIGTDYPKELNTFIVDAADYEETYPKDPKFLESIVDNAKKLTFL